MMIALSPDRCTKAYMYSTLIPASCRILRISPSPPGRSGTSRATTSVFPTVNPFSFRTCFARSLWLTIRRRIPKSAVSARESARIFTPAWKRIFVTSASRPYLFSRNIEICSTFIETPPCRWFSRFSFIDHAPGFPVAALDRLRLHELHLAGDAEQVLDLALDALRKRLEPLDLVREDRLAHLHLHLEDVQGPLAGNDHLVVGLDALDRHQDRLDLGREDVDPPDDEHVVGPPRDQVHPRVRPAAGAGGDAEARDVARPVADHGKGLLGDRGEDELARLPAMKWSSKTCRPRFSSMHSDATPGPMTSERP